ncbi:uncharacterized protein ARMOST_20691 [Armillaria ostoyae]|uniref:Uncharacterized protein n=1 Tax=Armillaria ostoyae TaxID=47428 RepID=A0A284S813_ARMOS|nr:uncharacterized protein ARMOST_20691 [Armillaria ostoyae]
MDATTDISRHAMLSIALSTSSRWKGLMLSLPYRSFHPFENIAGSFGYPETWFIKCTDEAGMMSPPSPILAFQDALRLEILALAQWNKSAITKLFQFPWDQITDVSNG